MILPGKLNISFREGLSYFHFLRRINLFIPKGKITAIVGSSGRGKTTLLKLLLAFHRPPKGDIRSDDLSLTEIDADDFRRQCGVAEELISLVNTPTF